MYNTHYNVRMKPYEHRYEFTIATVYGRCVYTDMYTHRIRSFQALIRHALRFHFVFHFILLLKLKIRENKENSDQDC